MEIIRFIVYGIIGILLQVSLLRVVLPDAVVPNFIVIFIVYLGYRMPTLRGAVIAFILGLEYDLFGSYLLLGPNAGSAVVLFMLVFITSKGLYLEQRSTVFFTVFLGTLVVYSVSYIITYQFIGSLWNEGFWLQLPWLEGIATGVAALFAFPLLDKAAVKGKARKPVVSTV
ncbi:MAG: hypothetical protein D6808_02365 [Candidatus Dadabacteria bacterium]|nr:MAG: hypothetical protein D6808_02365 [Candidatus Dadabacteria bacterium]